MSMSVAIVRGAVSIALAGCAQTELTTHRPQVDTSPVLCGHKWFQSGYSPDLTVDCSADRASLRDAQTVLALEHAWEVARARCPSVCPPRELRDTVEWQPTSPDGICRGGRVYYTMRAFFECAER